jgi:tRNA-dihydrouridine synthase
VKEAVRIPVFGNGDIFSPEYAKRMIDETGCDGVAIARGAKGNPWLIRRTIRYLESGELLPEPTPEERKAMAVRHAELAVRFKGEKLAIPEMRKHLAWYTSGLPGAAKLRAEMNVINSLDELRDFVGKM